MSEESFKEGGTVISETSPRSKDSLCKKTTNILFKSDKNPEVAKLKYLLLSPSL